MSKYYVVSSEILPEVLEKVMEAHQLLNSGQARRISEAVAKVGISRGTFYKYKDAVFSFSQDESTRKAIISFVIRHEKGALAQVINLLSQNQANILSLNQTAPINGIASLTVTIDMADLESSPEELILVLQQLPAVSRADLVAVE